MKHYLLGDSHATELHDRAFSVEWHTLLGFGLQSFAGGSDRRIIPETARKSIVSLLEKLDKGSTLLLSYTETDSRIAMGNEGHKTIYRDYRSALEEMLSLTEASKIVILDWYGIVARKVPEQTCMPLQRVENRKAQLRALEELNKDLPLLIDTIHGNELWETPQGFLKDPSLLKDGVHWNWSRRELSVLLDRFKEYLK